MQHFIGRFNYRAKLGGAAIFVSIVAAFLTAIALRLLKIRYKGREHFHHFKFLIAGIFFLLLSGVQFFTSSERGKPQFAMADCR